MTLPEVCDMFYKLGRQDERSEWVYKETVPDKILTEIIIDLCCKYYSISESVIISKRRHRHIVFPRQVTMYLLSKFTNMTLVDIGEKFGGRDHSTTIYARDTIKDLIETDETICKEIDVLSGQVHHLIARQELEIVPVKKRKAKVVAVPVVPFTRPAAIYSNRSPLGIANH